MPTPDPRPDNDCDGIPDVPDDPTQDVPAALPAGRTIRLINFGEADHSFELPKLGADGKPLRGPSRVEQRDGRDIVIPGKELMEYVRLGPASNRVDGGISPEVKLTAAEFARIKSSPGQAAVLAELVNKGEVSLFGASI